ncbi:hypothetical protein [Roseibacillus persicicus]|nr:hypothetical protein [Roseibacillus persicicus]
MEFENPTNGYVEEVDGAWFYTLLFGCFYLAYKGAWMAAIFAVIVAIFTFGISWLLLPIFAADILKKSYLQRGWIERTVETHNEQLTEPRKRSSEHQRKLNDVKKKMGW